MSDSKINSIPVLCGMPVEELAERLSPLPRFRAAQISKWIASGVSSFDEMDNLPLPLRTELAGRFTLRPNVTVQKHSSSDGTVKLALRFADGARIEAVLLSDNSGRRTACLSTQAGCPAGCVFCKTGAGFLRNLTAAEIVEQFLQLRTLADDSASSGMSPTTLPISNIVVMGMGEPLLNLAELRRALAVISSKEGLHFSRRRITVSTCGIARGITDLTDQGPAVRLALSLTTADENLRRRLMPITVREPLAAVKKALRHFQDSGGGRITLEAVLLGGINTRDEDAAGMARFARGLDAAVNLIPWNPVKGLEFEGKTLRQPSTAEIESFTQRLKTLGLNVTRRYRRGRGVMGACGQLSGN
ncbi:MAG: 23S rRNA (adenine(2503)-C(2))-methyltransferase RlmN [Treponema sp.]|jgi:23S rRNA (adenine2503-C2)-methyltransferase|nr:23S rRNA (adenine(2503)-C(2))-methyltransferase RlmN [Treponema sp.]